MRHVLNTRFHYGQLLFDRRPRLSDTQGEAFENVPVGAAIFVPASAGSFTAIDEKEDSVYEATKTQP
ncbi:hypothetical protein [Alloalcanivorax gelatiniphagus]|uniref:hypothetical protein n=1 Tax=Alloalcanivorax gelatiniphagus TaxID=1194167 RepID=UPI001476E978|nr:hypothetical protein [Alloalcanivorax gelatiniphagus]|tara:strand:- start:1738 stop:1938 length:201 start_codon:yes stop_codon:yes gene_type:complete